MTSPDPLIPGPGKPVLTCRDVLDFLMGYLDGQLEPQQRSEFERHLAACPSCVSYVSSYKATVTLGKAAMKDPDDPAAGTVPERLIHAIRQARQKGAAQS